MWTDPIVEEIHQIRLAHAEKCNFDLRAIFNDLKEHEKRNRRRVVTLPIKRQQPARKKVEEIDEVLETSV
jgi:hypothetical protein